MTSPANEAFPVMSSSDASTDDRARELVEVTSKDDDEEEEDDEGVDTSPLLRASTLLNLRESDSPADDDKAGPPAVKRSLVVSTVSADRVFRTLRLGTETVPVAETGSTSPVAERISSTEAEAEAEVAGALARRNRDEASISPDI